MRGRTDLRLSRVLIAIAVAALLAGSATVGAIIFFPPQRVDVKIAGPVQPVASRPGTWTFHIRNMGPNIGDVGLRLNGGDGWIAQHSIVNTSAGCQQPAQDGLLLCGPIQEGETRTISVTGTPKAAGNYSYEASFCDCSQGRQIALQGPNSPRFAIPGSQPGRYRETWTEVVLPQPTAAITVTDVNGHPLSGANVIVQGSSVSAITTSTGVARLGLGPLGPGIYTVVATHKSYLNTVAQITVPDLGDAPVVSI